MTIHVVLEKYKNLFENLTPQSVEVDFPQIFDSNIYFKDPFNAVRGLSAVQAVFQQMFNTLHEPYFHVLHVAGADNSGYLEWVLYFKLKSNTVAETQQIKGVSRILINDKQQVCSHIDYWDSGEFVYRKIPVLSSVIRFINKKIAVS